MKKLTFVLIGLLVMNLMAWAGNDKPIQVSEMPKTAQQFIKSHFAGHSVAIAKMDTDFLDKSYDVIFTNGDKVEFDKKGKWIKVDCEHTQVPQEIIPATILKYVKTHFPDTKVVKIELTDRKGYEVDLSNGFDIEFDKKMNVRDIDK